MRGGNHVGVNLLEKFFDLDVVRAEEHLQVALALQQRVQCTKRRKQWSAIVRIAYVHSHSPFVEMVLLKMIDAFPNTGYRYKIFSQHPA